MAELFFLVQQEDGFMSVIDVKRIGHPIKNQCDYKVRDVITARCSTRTCYMSEAVICEIHANKKFLEQKAKLPPKQTYDEMKGSHSQKDWLSVYSKFTVEERNNLDASTSAIVAAQSDNKRQVEDVETMEHNAKKMKTRKNQEDTSLILDCTDGSFKTNHGPCDTSCDTSSDTPCDTTTMSNISADKSTESETSDNEENAEKDDALEKHKLEKRVSSLEKELDELKQIVGSLKKKLDACVCDNVNTSASDTANVSYNDSISDLGNDASSICVKNEPDVDNTSVSYTKLRRDSTMADTYTDNDVEFYKLLESVNHLPANTDKEINTCIHRLCFNVFDLDELINSSITGKKTCKVRGTVKPALDKAKMQLLERAVFTKCETVTRKIFIAKLQNIIKIHRRKLQVSLKKQQSERQQGKRSRKK